MLHQQVALPDPWDAGFFLPSNSRMKQAQARLNAPGRCFLIRSIAFYGEHPLLTNANATKNGALPSPARQCTPILRTDLFLFVCSTPLNVDPVQPVPPPSLFSIPPSNCIICFFFVESVFASCPSPPAIYYADIASVGFYDCEKNSSTFASQRFIRSFGGSEPSGNSISYTLILL